MNEILKQLMERGYGVTLTIKNEYTVKNANVWAFDYSLALTYEKLVTALGNVVGRMQPGQIMMSPKTFKNMEKVLGLKK